MKTKITAEGWQVIDGDLISGWVESEKDLQHDKFLPVIACANMPEGGIVIDCGANIGSHTVAYSRRVGKDGAVIAIEAGKLAFDCLVENSKKFENSVLCINAAVCDVHGGTAIHSVNEVNVGGSVVSDENKEGVESNKIRTISLDGLIQDMNLKKLDFIKIDCEGYELKILKGAKHTLRKFKPILLIEMNSFRLQENGASYKDIYDLLLEENYSWRIVQPELKGGDLQYDVLCWPNIVIQTSRVLPGDSL